jgi:autotransporter-associated beta strand protein
MEVHSRRRPRKRAAPCQWKLIAAAGVVCLPLARPAGGATTLDNVPDSSYTAYSAQPQFAASGYVEINAGQIFGSGTLIAPDWVITAAHNVTTNTTGYPAYSPSQVTFGTGASAKFPGTSSVSEVIVEPGWSYNLGAGDDLALLKLTTPITDVAIDPIYTSSLGTEVGQTASVVGYGRAGTGLTGITINPGVRRAFTNVIDSLGNQLAGGIPALGMSSNIMFDDFDSPGGTSSIMGDSTPTALEGISAPGDSGGSVYLTNGGTTYLAGVVSFLGSLPSNPLSSNPDGHYGDYNGYTRLSAAQSVNFINSVLQPNSSWNTAGSGSWAATANWSGANIPEFTGAVASFTTAVSTSATVTLDGTWTVGGLTFDSSNTYTLSPGTNGSLTLDNGGISATATITDSNGTHCLNAPLTLNSNLLVTVNNAGDTMKLWGSISGPGGLSVSGAGTVALTATNTYQGGTAISGGSLNIISSGALPAGSPVLNNGALIIKADTSIGNISGGGALTIGTSAKTATLAVTNGSGASTLSSLSIGPGSTLDVGNNSLVINYNGASPDAVIAAALATGYNGGAWTGTGITSRAAAASANTISVGFIDSNTDANSGLQPNQLLIKATEAGDATLDGVVNWLDLVVVVQHFNTLGNDWFEGNFNYNPTGLVNFQDLVIVVQNFGQGLSSSQNGSGIITTGALSPGAGPALQFAATTLPEPAIGAIGAIAAGGLLRRRRANSRHKSALAR